MMSHQFCGVKATFLVFVLGSLGRSGEGVRVSLESYLQPNNVAGGDYDDFRPSNSTLCLRPCDGKPRICYYRFILEQYSAMGPACGMCPFILEACSLPQCVTADGFERSILTVNRMLPGPSIQVCKGDTLVIDVKNMFLSQSATIHWHGIDQRRSPFMDGVPMVTQCPINPGEIFRYRFRVEKAGTFFWHSQSGLQKLDGVYGSLIVREPRLFEPSGYLYDADLPSHSLLISDWIHTVASERFPGLQRKETGYIPDTYLINGKGVHMKSVSMPLPETSVLSKLVSTFDVIKSVRYRFRIIGATSLSCPVEIFFDKHKLLVIATDGGNFIEPKLVDSVVLLPGERVDVVLDANQKGSFYWIFLNGLGECSDVHQMGLLRYQSHATESPPALQSALIPLPTRTTLNSPMRKCDFWNTKNICIHELQSRSRPPQEIIDFPPDYRIVIAFGTDLLDPEELFFTSAHLQYYEPLVPVLVRGHINNISNIISPSPLLSQLNDVPQNLICPPLCDRNNICQCINIISIPLGAIVEIVLADAGPHLRSSPESFHLHGYEFYVLDQGTFGGPLKHSLALLNKKLNLASYSNRYPPVKDTVAVPTDGYSVIRFKASNPGFWFLHSEFLLNMNVGMSATIKVGETNDFEEIPRNFPKCGDYLPFYTIK